MKRQILEIADDLSNDAINPQQARTQLLRLFGVNVSSSDPALKLAGKMAIAAETVINSNANTVSNAVAVLEDALTEYNNEIFSRL